MMTLRRHALLIGCDHADWPGHELPGSRVDLENLCWYLQQPLGGAWQEDEISVLFNPDASEILGQLGFIVEAYETLDYLLVYYTGHGSLDDQGQTRLRLGPQPETQLVVDQLFCPVSRQLTLMDCCRNLCVMVAAPFSVTDDVFGGVQPVIGDPGTCRDAFDAALAASPTGACVAWACAPAEISASDPRLGGRFTYGLVLSALARLEATPPPCVVTFPEVFAVARDWVLEDSSGLQNPEINNPVPWPLAVRT